LDEADLLGDHIAILGAPGKLLANGSPVTLKRDLGEGYTVQVLFEHSRLAEKSEIPSQELLQRIQTIIPETHLTMPSLYIASYHLRNKDTAQVEKVLQLLENEKNQFHVASYDVLGTTIENIFLDLMWHPYLKKAVLPYPSVPWGYPSVTLSHPSAKPLPSSTRGSSLRGGAGSHQPWLCL
jgi:ATP-binding cassette, subfamily A (ABC1), member 3